MRKGTLIVLGVLALPSFAGIKSGGTTYIDSLRIDGRSYGTAPWSPLAPTIRAQEGYLAYDAAGKSTTVTFRKEKGPGTKWSFVETNGFAYSEPDGTYDGLPVRRTYRGYTMKV